MVIGRTSIYQSDIYFLLKQGHYTKETILKTSQVELVVKNLPANAGDVRYVGLIPGSGRSLGVGNSNPL